MDEREPEGLSANSAAVIAYLGALQDTIKRLAGNSGQCKAWCITITVAIVILSARDVTPNHVWISIIPIIMFCYLDAYYLSLERIFVDTYKDISDKVRNETITLDDLFVFPTPRIDPVKDKLERLASTLISTSVTPFYVLLLLFLCSGQF